MKRGNKIAIIACMFFILSLSFLIVGCAGLGLPERPSEQQEQAVQEKAEVPAPVAPTPTPQTVEEDQIMINESLNETNTTEEPAELPISGSMELQSDMSLCPHLTHTFECDKYDIRRCKFKQFVGDQEFFPDYMLCTSEHDGKIDEDKKYCFIQECDAIVKGNLAEKYGGIIAHAEYGYREEKTGTGIITHYELLKCGEVRMEFDSKQECTEYYPIWRKLWV